LPYNIKFYKKIFTNINEKKLLELFQKTLIKTNRNHKFFVDWNKVLENANYYKYELNLLNVLINSNNFKNKFFDLLKKYPEVVRVFPILIAIRDLEFPIIQDFTDKEVSIIEYSFDVRRGTTLTDDQINNYYNFIEKTGLIRLFNIIKDFYDYIIGVEVGMDTNARKNRGGRSMELLIKPKIYNLSKRYDLKFYSQKKFKFIRNKFDLDIPKELENRKCDFILIKDLKYLNIEVNYYSGSGSKPEEIVDAYINRYNEITKKGGYFIWITDGDVWRTSKNQLDKGLQYLPYLLNIFFVRKGLLEEAIKEIFFKF